MNKPNVILAIAAGALSAFYFSNLPNTGSNFGRIMAGITMGTVLAASMIRHPARITRWLLWLFIVPLLVLLLIFTHSGDGPEFFRLTVIWATLFVGVLALFVRRNSRAATADSDTPPT